MGRSTKSSRATKPMDGGVKGSRWKDYAKDSCAESNCQWYLHFSCGQPSIHPPRGLISESERLAIFSKRLDMFSG